MPLDLADYDSCFARIPKCPPPALSAPPQLLEWCPPPSSPSPSLPELPQGTGAAGAPSLWSTVLVPSTRLRVFVLTVYFLFFGVTLMDSSPLLSAWGLCVVLLVLLVDLGRSWSTGREGWDFCDHGYLGYRENPYAALKDGVVPSISSAMGTQALSTEYFLFNCTQTHLEDMLEKVCSLKKVKHTAPP